MACLLVGTATKSEFHFPFKICAHMSILVCDTIVAVTNVWIEWVNSTMSAMLNSYVNFLSKTLLSFFFMLSLCGEYVNKKWMDIQLFISRIWLNCMVRLFWIHKNKLFAILPVKLHYNGLLCMQELNLGSHKFYLTYDWHIFSFV